MLSFLIGLALLIGGYAVYGKLVEKVVAPDDRETPAKRFADGVDFVALPHWKNMLIQLLNIAGIGPVIGVIIGIKFGLIVFLIIPIGNIIAGATHDFLGGMMSLRHNGANLPELVHRNLGTGYYWLFSGFMIFLLLLVVAVFINVPASLFSELANSATGSADAASGAAPAGLFWGAVIAIFAYYVAATLFPVDKIIGRIYPLFGVMLLLGTVAIFGALIYNFDVDFSHGSVLISETSGFEAQKWTAANGHPVIPLLFVTIACGIISGFHATQSPIIARTMESERQARSSFYGMMVLEGIIAMIWAGAGMAIYNLYPDLMQVPATKVLVRITTEFLGSGWGTVTVVAVMILAITSGDTAMRSLRLSLAEMFNIKQRKVVNRVLLCLPLIAAVAVLLYWSNLSARSFNKLWNYFAWGNQVLAASTLMAATVWLIVRRRVWSIAVVPGMFMTFIVLCYILWISEAHGGPVGFGMELNSAYRLSALLTAILAAIVVARGYRLRQKDGQ